MLNRLLALVVAGTAVLAAIAAALPPAGSVASAATAGGKAVYANCQACHGERGQGTPGAFPPLAGNPDVVAKNPARLIGIVKNGLGTELKVKGVTYTGQMPAWKGSLSNAEIAAVLTYIRSSWGNKAAAISEKAVAAVK